MSRLIVLNPDPQPRQRELGELGRALLSAARDGVDGEELGRLAGELQAADPAELATDDARTALWLNVYNALVAHYMRTHRVRRTIVLEPMLFDRAAYRVGGQTYTLNQIEHGLLRSNRRPPYHRRPALAAADPRLEAAPGGFDPRIHFALNCGARSCPAVRAYDETLLDAQLESATTGYLRAETELEIPARRVRLPGLLRLYHEDFGERAEQLAFVAERVPDLGEMLRERGRVRVSHRRFDWHVVVRPDLVAG